MKPFAFAVLLGAVLLSGHLVASRESEWCAQQRRDCESRCPADAKVDFKCQDADGTRAVSCACVSADGTILSSSSSSSGTGGGGLAFSGGWASSSSRAAA